MQNGILPPEHVATVSVVLEYITISHDRQGDDSCCRLRAVLSILTHT